MSYIVTKTVNGRRYLYLQRTYRQDGHVRTQSRYLGPADGAKRSFAGSPRKRTGLLKKLGGFIEANRMTPEDRFRHVDEKAMLEAMKVREAARAKALTQLHERYGLKLGPATPTPMEKPAPTIDDTSRAAAAAAKGPAVETAGQERSE